MDELKIFTFTDSEMLYINENFKKKAIYNRELTIKKNLTNSEIAAFEVRSFDLDHISIEKGTADNQIIRNFFSCFGLYWRCKRFELSAILLSQDLKPIETEFAYSNGFIKGMTGIENIYDKDLRGLFGKEFMK